MRLKRLCLAAVTAALLSGCAAGRNASVDLVEQVDVPPAHTKQYNPRSTDRSRQDRDSAADESENSPAFPRGKSVSQSRVTEASVETYEATADELDDYIIETGLRERLRERRESGMSGTPFCDRLRENFRRDACGDESRHPLCDRLRERLRGDGDHPLCDRIRERMAEDRDRPLCNCIRERLNGEGERPLCDALTSLFCCELPEGPWPFRGTETWDPSGTSCRCSGSSRTVIPQTAPAKPYDPQGPAGHQPDVQEFQPQSGETAPAAPNMVPMPSDVPAVPEGALPEIVPGDAEGGKVVEPPLWFRIRDKAPEPSIEPAPDAPASEATPETPSEPAAEPVPANDPAPAPEPTSPTEPPPVPPVSDESVMPEEPAVPEVPATDRPELPPLPSAESEPAVQSAVPALPPAPAPRLRQTRIPRSSEARVKRVAIQCCFFSFGGRKYRFDSFTAVRRVVSRTRRVMR